MSDQNYHDWQTDETRAALAAIRKPHAGKKRTTAIVIAFALATSGQDDATALGKVFDRPDTCARSIWYGETRKNGKVKIGWRDVPEISQAVKIITTRILEWRDAETARIEGVYRVQRLRSVAKYAADAPGALAAVMAGSDQRGSDRINAAMKLIGLADPHVGDSAISAPVSGGTNVEQTNANIGNVSELSDAELDARIRELVAGEPRVADEPRVAGEPGSVSGAAGGTAEAKGGGGPVENHD